VASAGEGVDNLRVIGEADDKAEVGFVGQGERVIRRKGVRKEGSSKAWAKIPGRKRKSKYVTWPLFFVEPCILIASCFGL